MKRFLSVFLMIALLVSSVSFVFAKDFLTDSKENKNILEQELSKLIDKQMKLYKWKLIDSSYEVVAQSVDNDKLTVDYSVAITHRLDYPAAKDVPVLKGKMKYLDELNANAKANSEKIRYAKAKVAQWEKNLQSYINEDQQMYETIRVVALLNDKNEVVKNSIQFSFQQPDDSFTSADEFLVVDSEDEVFQSSYDDIKKNATKIKETDSTRPAAYAYIPTYDAYDSAAAVSYANKWVKATTKACKTGSTTVQDYANYNPAYAKYQCNDCANFVSQCLYAGGIPQTTTWAPGKLAWINTGYSSSYYGLVEYMVDNYYAISTTKASVEAGGMISMTGYSHVMFVVYNDGTTVKYNAHSSDRYQSGTSTGSGMSFYNIERIVLDV